MRKVQTNAELGAFHARGKGADAGNARTRLGDDRLVRGSPAPGRASLRPGRRWSRLPGSRRRLTAIRAFPVAASGFFVPRRTLGDVGSKARSKNLTSRFWC